VLARLQLVLQWPRSRRKPQDKTDQEKGPGGVIEEHDGGGHEHGESDEFVQLVTSHRRRAVSSVFSQGWATL
jgi:hypothetical protein